MWYSTCPHAGFWALATKPVRFRIWNMRYRFSAILARIPTSTMQVLDLEGLYISKTRGLTAFFAQRGAGNAVLSSVAAPSTLTAFFAQRGAGNFENAS